MAKQESFLVRATSPNFFFSKMVQTLGLSLSLSLSAQGSFHNFHDKVILPVSFEGDGLWVFL